MERPWLKHYQQGVPSDITLDTYKSLVDFFEDTFKKYFERDSFYCMGKSITYGELEELSRFFGSYLLNDLGLQKGDRVAIMAPNILQYPVAMMGILRAGLTVVNVNPLYTPRELEHQLRDSGAKVIFVVENFAKTLAEVVNRTPIQKTILTSLGDMLAFPKGSIVNFVVKHLKKMVPAYELSNFIHFKEVLRLGSQKTFNKFKVDLEDIAFLQYTGGTTGVSKGAILTHRNILANIEQAYSWLKPSLGNGQEIVITALPLYHIFSLTANCMTFLKVGGKNILITNPRDLPGFIKELKKHAFTAFTGVNTLFNGLNHHPEFASVDFSHLKITLGGGIAVQKKVAEDWKRITKKPLIQAYGLTETSPAACINPLHLEEFNGSIGVPISSTYVTVRDEAGKEQPIGEPGELWIKGPQVMKGYWQKESETNKVLTTDGWLKTGDMAKIDADGFVTIVDRKKDMINVSGFNVYPNEVEEVCVEHKGVLEAAAIGVEDEKSGEAVKIFVIKKDPTLTAEDLIAHCRKYLTGYKVPKYVEFRDELPKSNVGKILRRSLKEPHEA